MASFSNSWGFGQKTKDSSSAPPHDLNVGKHSKQLSMNIPNLTKTYKASCILSITGDYERETSAFIVSRFLLQTTQMLAYPSPDTEDESRNVIVLMPDDDNDASVLRSVVNSIKYSLGLDMIAPQNKGLRCDVSLHLQPALLFAFLHHLLSSGWFHPPLDSSASGALHAARRVRTVSSDSRAQMTQDCDVVALLSLSISGEGEDQCHQQSKDKSNVKGNGKDKKEHQSTVILTYSTECYRILPVDTVLQKGTSIRNTLHSSLNPHPHTPSRANTQTHTPLNLNQVTETTSSWVYQEALRRIREEQVTAVGLHDNDKYELAMLATTSTEQGEWAWAGNTRVGAANTAYLTPLELRSRQQGFLLFLPSDEDEFMLYWQLRVGNGLLIGNGDAKIARDAHKRSDSMDSMDSMDSLPNSPTAAGDNATSVSLIRMSPAPKLNSETWAGRQAASRILPLDAMCEDFIEVPYLSRSRAVEASNIFVHDATGWKLATNVANVKKFAERKIRPEDCHIQKKMDNITCSDNEGETSRISSTLFVSAKILKQQRMLND